MARVKSLLSRMVPFSLRVEWQRLKRLPADFMVHNRLSSNKGVSNEFPFVLSESVSPLERTKGAMPSRLQNGKENNIALAIRAIDKVTIDPGRIFSYHRLVGRPSRLRGYKTGLELHDSEKSAGIGGGCCQISNMIYWLALNAGMIIKERHRHAFDLFPDSDRRIPFGCGATVFYNYRDLRFENPLDVPIMINFKTANGELIGKFLAPSDPGYRIVIEERGHHFFNEDGVRMRENWIYRRINDIQGRLITEELIAHNRCMVMY